MRVRSTVPIAAILALVSGFPLFAADKPGPSGDVTLQGEVVDLACYLGQGARGPDHRKCAVACARMGQPLGLLTTDGKLYILVADHQSPEAFQKARDLAGEKVELTGETAQRDGISALTVHGAKK
jgi:hypothetical protein